MNTTSSVKHVRQQQMGTFTRPEDGKYPFAHVNRAKIDSVGARTIRSFYVKGMKTASYDKGVLDPDFPKLFDHNAGLEMEVDKIIVSNKEQKTKKQKTVTSFAPKEKASRQDDQKRVIDEWA
jgi:hypothetical protein